MHDMHKIDVDVTFTHMKAKKGIKNHGEREVYAMYKEYTKFKDTQVMGVVDPYSLTR